MVMTHTTPWSVFLSEPHEKTTQSRAIWSALRPHTWRWVVSLDLDLMTWEVPPWPHELETSLYISSLRDSLDKCLRYAATPCDSLLLGGSILPSTSGCSLICPATSMPQTCRETHPNHPIRPYPALQIKSRWAAIRGLGIGGTSWHRIMLVSWGTQIPMDPPGSSRAKQQVRWDMRGAGLGASEQPSYEQLAAGPAGNWMMSKVLLQWWNTLVPDGSWFHISFKMAMLQELQEY